MPGARLLVHPPFQRAEYPVYTLNERMIFRLSTRIGLVRGRHGRRLGCGKHHAALRPAVSTGSRRLESSSLGVASGRQTRRLDRDVRARFLGRLDHVGIARGDALVSPNEKVHYGQPVLGFARARIFSRSGVVRLGDDAPQPR